VSDSRPEPGHHEIEELLGVYALDAVDPETARLVERHLETCVRCSVEVAQHHEVAGLLANSGGESPPELWDTIAGRLDRSAPPSWERLAAQLEDGVGRPERLAGGDAPVVPGPSRRRAPSLVAAGAVVVAAAAAVVAIVLGVQVNHLDRQVSSLQSTSALVKAERSAMAARSTRMIELTAPAGTPSPSHVLVVLAASGTGFVQVRELPALPTDRTYQLWGVVGGQTISLGLLGPDPIIVPFSVAGRAPVRAFAITDEHSGGVVQTTRQPVVAGQVGA
jgi:anti-sigma factor RsiW